MAEYSPVPIMQRRLWLARIVAFGLALALAAGLGRLPAAQAGGDILVNTAVDEMTVNGKCSLREAVQSANTHTPVDTCAGHAGDNTIVLPPTTYVLSIPKTGANDNTSGNLNLTSNIILGPTFCAGICFSTIISGAAGWDDQMIRISNNAQVTLSQLTIQGGNSAESGGAAQVQTGWLVLTGTAIYNNRAANYGGGLFSALSNMTIVNSSIVSNSAPAGGGLFSLGARIELQHSTVMSNTASRFGGGGIGVSGVNYATTLAVTDSALRGNLANGSGGGLNAYVSTVGLTNTTVSGNRGGNGGGLYVELTSLDLNNVTVAFNTSGFNGGGLRVNTQATVTMANSILALNTDLAGGKPDCSATLISRGYNLIQNIAGCTITGVTTGNRLGLNPLLLPLAFSNGWVHPLHFLSPAVDAGSPAAPNQPGACAGRDQRGQIRPRDGDGDAVPVCDMGAYEVQIPTVIRRVRLPAVYR